MNDSDRTQIILTGLAEGQLPEDIAAALCDRECAAGEYEGCSSELEFAYSEHIARIDEVARERERNRAYAQSRRLEYNHNANRPVCQGGPRWYL